MNVAPPQRSLMSLYTQLHHHHGSGSAKMESIGEISNETTSSSTSHFTAKDHSAKHDKGNAISKSTPDDVYLELYVSGEKVDVSNLIPEGERPTARLDRKRIKEQLFHVNEIVYPKLSEEIDIEIDIPTLLQQGSKTSSPSVPEEYTIHQPPPSHHRYPSSTSSAHDRRAMWQQSEFAQHSFTRRQQERSHYPYARADDSRRQFAGEGEPQDNPYSSRSLIERYELHRRPSSRRQLDNHYSVEPSFSIRRSREGSFRSRFDDRNDLPYDNNGEFAYPMGVNDVAAQYHGPSRYPPRESQGSDLRLGTSSSRRWDRNMSGRHRSSEMSCGSLVYMEDMGRGSSQNLIMPRDFDREMSHLLPQQPQPNQLEVEIAPGVSERLRGAEETSLALEQGRVAASDCLCCGARSLCIADASYLLCPICKVVSPTGNDCGDNGGVGLGIVADQY